MNTALHLILPALAVLAAAGSVFYARQARRSRIRTEELAEELRRMSR